MSRQTRKSRNVDKMVQSSMMESGLSWYRPPMQSDSSFVPPDNNVDRRSSSRSDMSYSSRSQHSMPSKTVGTYSKNRMVKEHLREERDRRRQQDPSRHQDRSHQPPLHQQPYFYDLPFSPFSTYMQYQSNQYYGQLAQRRLLWIVVMAIGFISVMNIVSNSIETRRSVLENSIGYVEAQVSAQQSQQLYHNVNNVHPQNNIPVQSIRGTLMGGGHIDDGMNQPQMELRGNGGGYITDNGEVVDTLPKPIIHYRSEEEEAEQPPNIQEQKDFEDQPPPSDNDQSPDQEQQQENGEDEQEGEMTETDGADSTELPTKKKENSSLLDWFVPIFDQAPIEDVPEVENHQDRLILFDEEEESDLTKDGDMTEETSSGGSSSSTEGLVGLPEVKSDGSIPLMELNNIKDNSDGWDRSDVPIFLHIPKAGGSTVKDIMGTCHRFVMATDNGILDGHVDDEDIAIVYPGGGPPGQDRSPFVNVDTTTVGGIARAKEMGFADSRLAEAVVTPFIFEVNDLFTHTTQGRLFTVFRHPIERAISMFFYIQIADWEPTYSPELKYWSIEQYATSSLVENNWLTRMLSNQPEDDLSDVNLNIAKEVIRRKFVVGLVTEIEETMSRFETFFRWTFRVMPPNQEACRENLLSRGSNSNSNNNNKPEPGSKEWDMLVEQNEYDLELYSYIEDLFKEQEKLVKNLPENFRNIDATCCKCGPPSFPKDYQYECPLAIMN